MVQRLDCRIIKFLCRHCAAFSFCREVVKLAATRLIALHKNKGKSVAACLKSRTDYAQNPDKTQQGELVSSYECSPLTVDEEFMLSKRQYELVTGRRQKNDVIAYQRFSDNLKCVIWENSEIRTWLNQEFYAEAFDETEQASIRETTLENLSTAGFAAHVDPSGDVQVRESRPDTKDKIFLLSWKEAEQYYGNRLTDAYILGRRPSRAVLQKRETIFTDIIIEELPAMYPYSRHLADGTERLPWMLRSTGMKDYNILVIGYEGKWDQDYPDSYNGVRPAMWVNVGD